jgi:predicted glutamine amidotransferase
MCGIAGYIATSDSEKLRTIAGILALKMEDRGAQSWGIMYGDGKASPAVHRVADSVSKTFDLPEVMPPMFALHTRYATTGSIKPGNAHPFTKDGAAGRVVGMHNGIISNHAQLGRVFKRSYRVDSEHIFAHLADGLALDDLEGYGTVVYSLNGEWFIGKFNGGELAVVRTELGIFYASTESSLRLAMRIAGVEILEWITTKDGTLYRITRKGLSKVNKSLTVSFDLYCGSWEMGYGDAALDVTVDFDFIPEDVEVATFDSDGQECDDCLIRTSPGSTLYWFEESRAAVCEKCARKNFDATPVVATKRKKGKK